MKLEQIYNKLNEKNTNQQAEKIRSYGILIPLVEIDHEVHVLFEVRSMKLRSQPGEICFPGGRMEEYDQSPEEAAVRETSEELGITKDLIKNVLPLQVLRQPWSNRILYPAVGTITKPEKIKPNEDEVQEIFTVPLNHLLEQKPEVFKLEYKIASDSNFPFHLIRGAENYRSKTLSLHEDFYFYKDYAIWGLTAKILRNFLDIVRS